MASPAASQDTGVVVEDTGQDTRHRTYSTRQEVSSVQGGEGGRGGVGLVPFWWPCP